MNISLSTFLTKVVLAEPPVLANKAKQHFSVGTFLSRLITFVFLIAWTFISASLAIEMIMNEVIIFCCVTAVGGWFWWIYAVFYQKKKQKRKEFVLQKNPTFFYDVLAIVTTLIIIVGGPFTVLLYEENIPSLFLNACHLCLFGLIIVLFYKRFWGKDVGIKTAEEKMKLMAYLILFFSFFYSVTLAGDMAFLFYGVCFPALYFTSYFRKTRHAEHDKQEIPLLKILSFFGIEKDVKNQDRFVLPTSCGNVCFGEDFRFYHFAERQGLVDWVTCGLLHCVCFDIPMDTSFEPVGALYDALISGDTSSENRKNIEKLQTKLDNLRRKLVNLCEKCHDFVTKTKIGQDLFFLAPKQPDPHYFLYVDDFDESNYKFIETSKDDNISFVISKIAHREKGDILKIVFYTNVSVNLQNKYYYYTEDELKQIYTEIENFQHDLEDFFKENGIRA